MNRQASADWSPSQERVALLLAAGRSIRAAAREADCGERTVFTWLDDARYRAYIAELRGRMLDAACGSLSRATGAAVNTLRKLLTDANGNVRLRAALGILDAVVKLRDSTELDARILRLEQDSGPDHGDGPRRIIIPDVDDRFHRTDPKGWDEGTERPAWRPYHADSRPWNGSCRRPARRGSATNTRTCHRGPRRSSPAAVLDAAVAIDAATGGAPLGATGPAILRHHDRVIEALGAGRPVPGRLSEYREIVDPAAVAELLHAIGYDPGSTLDDRHGDPGRPCHPDGPRRPAGQAIDPGDAPLKR